MAKELNIYVGQTVYMLTKAILEDNGVEGFSLWWEYPMQDVTPPSVIISSIDFKDAKFYGIGERGRHRTYEYSVRVCAEDAIREMTVREILEMDWRDIVNFNIRQWLDEFPPSGPGAGTVIREATASVVDNVKQHDPYNPLEQLRYTGYIILQVETGRLGNDEW